MINKTVYTPFIVFLLIPKQQTYINHQIKMTVTRKEAIILRNDKALARVDFSFSSLLEDSFFRFF
jgi:hypothetical protein